MKNTVFNAYQFPLALLYLILGLILMGCQLIEEQAQVLPISYAETKTPTPQINLVEPEPVITATPYTRPTIIPLDTLPEDLKPTFDRELCADYCWHGVMLGQSEVEVLNTLRNDPYVDKITVFDHGDFLHIERTISDNWDTSIAWHLTAISQDRDPYRINPFASVSFLKDKANFIVIPTELFRLQIMLDLLGEPEFIGFVEVEEEFVTFSLHYPEDRLSIMVRTEHFPTKEAVLSGDSFVEQISFVTSDLAQKIYCTVGYMHWAGLGGVTKYFPPANQNILITAESIPEWCNK